MRCRVPEWPRYDHTGDGRPIEPGMAGDLVLLDYARMASDALSDDADELDFLFVRGRKDYVHGLMVAGRSIVENGTLTSIRSRST